MELTLQEGGRLVAVARDALDRFLRTAEVARSPLAQGLTEPGGAFCTLKAYPSGDLRGCAGRPYPEEPLVQTVITAAVSSAQDPRFKPLEVDELASTVIHVSILSIPERIVADQGKKYSKLVRPGMDGLILRHGCLTGLLLPQVWEAVPNVKAFLSSLCLKAGLSRGNAWQDSEATLYRFSVRAFCERTPAGEVEEESGPWSYRGRAG